MRVSARGLPEVPADRRQRLGESLRGGGRPFLAWNVRYRTALPKPKGYHPRTYLRHARAVALMTQQNRWWLAISIVWLFLSVGMLLYLGYA